MSDPSPLVYRVSGAEGPEWAIRQGDVFRRVAESVADLAERLDDREPFGESDAEVGAVSETPILPPASPTKIVCTGRNYRQHAEELGNEVPDEPLLFLKPPSALVGPHDSVELPDQSDEVHFEGEVAVVFGETLREVEPNEAEAGILGYACANDVTARDIQNREGAFTRAKGFDTFCPLGPGLAVGDRFVPETAEIETRVNGEPRQHAPLRDLIFPVPELVSFVSDVMTLHPGDILLTGTPPGVGPIEPGDVVEVAVAGVGELTNPVDRRRG